MAKKAVDVNALLGGLLNDIDTGAIKEKLVKKEKKGKKQLLIGQENMYTYKLHEPSMKGVALVLERHEYECLECGRTHVAPNLHILTIKEDKHGNRHETQFVAKSDIDDLPRMERPVKFKVQACQDCFQYAVLKPVMTDEAKERINEIDVDDEINKLLFKWEEEGK